MKTGNNLNTNEFISFDTDRFIRERFHVELNLDMHELSISLEAVTSIGSNVNMIFTTDIFVDRHAKDEHVSFKSPVSWFQHFKKDCFPKWLLKRFPVKCRTEEVRVRFIKDFFPDLPAWHKRMSSICKKDHVGLISREYIDIIGR